MSEQAGRPGSVARPAATDQEQSFDKYPNADFVGGELRTSGFPAPDTIERFEAVQPGAFDRILRLSEQLQAAQIEAAMRAQDLTHGDVRRGHWLGAGVMFSAMLIALVLALLGHDGVALGALALPVTSVAKAIIDGVRSAHKR